MNKSWRHLRGDVVFKHGKRIERRELNDMDCIVTYVSPVYPQHHCLEVDLKPNVNMASIRTFTNY